MNSLMFFLITLITTPLCAATLPIGIFSKGEIGLWESESFSGETRYTIDQQEGRKVLRADANASASGLVKKAEIDLNATPYLHWDWKVDASLPGLNERSKPGDDYAARVYVVVSGGAFFWKTRTLVYVWSGSEPVGTSWKNAYTGNARHIALRSGNADAGDWVSEKRNVRVDFKNVFGDDIEKLDAVAIMTDTDNSGLSATAWYGDITFSSE